MLGFVDIEYVYSINSGQWNRRTVFYGLKPWSIGVILWYIGKRWNSTQALMSNNNKTGFFFFNIPPGPYFRRVNQLDKLRPKIQMPELKINTIWYDLLLKMCFWCHDTRKIFQRNVIPLLNSSVSLPKKKKKKIRRQNPSNLICF